MLDVSCPHTFGYVVYKHIQTVNHSLLHQLILTGSFLPQYAYFTWAQTFSWSSCSLSSPLRLLMHLHLQSPSLYLHCWSWWTAGLHVC
uniref:Uncharacterized protein n=1 Tax=Anguilla anguilla TaxID=7936 RepID=A0A0E9W119_ANGAN